MEFQIFTFLWYPHNMDLALRKILLYTIVLLTMKYLGGGALLLARTADVIGLFSAIWSPKFFIKHPIHTLVGDRLPSISYLVGF